MFLLFPDASEEKKMLLTFRINKKSVQYLYPLKI